MNRPVFWLAIVSYLVLTLGYLVFAPVFEAPDENTHFQYVRHIADTGSLPLIPGMAERNGRSILHEAVQAYHPPLYYAVLAGTMSVLGYRDTVATWATNPNYGAPDPEVRGRYIHDMHGADERPPASPEVGMYRLLRGWSVLFGLIAIIITHRLGLLAFPLRPAIADTAALLLACLPKWNFILGVVNNGNLVTCLSHIALLMLALVLIRGRITVIFGVSLGLVIGLALLTKMTSMFLLPLAALVFLYGLWQWAEQRRAILWSGVALVLVVVAVSSWFFLRNWSLYDSALALDVHQASFGGKLRIPKGEVWSYLLGPFLPTLFRSFVSDLGWFCFPTATWIHWLWKVVAVLAGAGLLLRVVRPRRHGEGHGNRVVITFLVIAAVLVFALTVNYNTMMRGSHGRYLFPVMGAFAVLFAAGLHGLIDLIPTSARRVVLSVLALAPPLIGGSILFLQFLPAYRPELTSAPPTYATLTAGLTTEPEQAAIELLEPADGAALCAPPLLCWQAPATAGDPPLYTVHMYTERGRVLFATYEMYGQEITEPAWQLPQVAWDLVVPKNEPIFWKIRQVPNRALGENVGDTAESNARHFIAR